MSYDKKVNPLMQTFKGKEVEVFENLDLYKIYVNIGDSGLKFYKKNGCVIDNVERTLTSIWEKPISYISERLKDTQLSGDMYVGVLFLPELDEKGKIMSMDGGEMIISDVCHKNKRFKSINRLPRYVVDLVSTALGIKVSSPIFKGVMSETHFDSLMSYAETPTSTNLHVLFEALDNKATSSKGVIVTCPQTDETVTINTDDYSNLTRMISDHRCDRNFYESVIIDFVTFINECVPSDSFDSVIGFADCNTTEGDERYMCIINALYDVWVHKTTLFEKFVDVDVEMPVFIKDVKVDTRFIDSTSTIDNITEYRHKLYAYKIILNALRTKKCVKDGKLKEVESYVSALYKKIGYSNEPKK